MAKIDDPSAQKTGARPAGAPAPQRGGGAAAGSPHQGSRAIQSGRPPGPPTTGAAGSASSGRRATPTSAGDAEALQRAQAARKAEEQAKFRATFQKQWFGDGFQSK